MNSFDHSLFLFLNFDGGDTIDRLMLTISGTAMWIPLYILILWLVWREGGWRGIFFFLILMGTALALADIVAGIFKTSGLLKGLMPDSFQPRWRPMYTPALEGLDITPDSLKVLRKLAPEALAATGFTPDWAVHVPSATGGNFGTVSAHAATSVALATLSITTVRRRWFTILMVICTVAICYSRIYLAKHFPMDIMWGTLLGLVLGIDARLAYLRFTAK